MVTDTRTTPIRTDTSRSAAERADTANQAALWIILAVIAFAALGYAFYHYSNPANNPSASRATTSDQSMPATSNGTTNGTMMNNDTSNAPNTGTPTTNSNTSQPSSGATGSGNPDTAPNASSTVQ